MLEVLLHSIVMLAFQLTFASAISSTAVEGQMKSLNIDLEVSQISVGGITTPIMIECGSHEGVPQRRPFFFSDSVWAAFPLVPSAKP